MMRGIILKDSVSKESTHNAVQKVGERKGEECSSNSFGPDPTAETAKGGGGEGEKDGRGSERSENNGNNKNNKTDNNDKNNINNSICSSSSSSSSSSDKNTCDCANNNDDDDNREEGGDDGLIMFSLSPGDRDLAPLRESIAPHKIVNRKRGDQEARIELYGAWQTVPYEVIICDHRPGVLKFSYAQYCKLILIFISIFTIYKCCNILKHFLVYRPIEHKIS